MFLFTFLYLYIYLNFTKIYFINTFFEEKIEQNLLFFIFIILYLGSSKDVHLRLNFRLLPCQIHLIQNQISLYFLSDVGKN